MREQILAALRNIEEEHRVSVLFACESGSRAWGFASTDSDYDVRFIYAHAPSWYLSIENHRDVIEKNLPGDLDVSGWELRKALRLFKKSNPPMLEWLNSPIVYRKEESFLRGMKDVAWDPAVENSGWGFSPQACFKHYFSMARGNMRNYFDAAMVPLKKYLYVVRPLLACAWIEGKMTIPPVLFDALVDEMVRSNDLKQTIQDLLAIKKGGKELGAGPHIPLLDEFIEKESARMAEVRNLLVRQPDAEGLNKLFARTIGLG